VKQTKATGIPQHLAQRLIGDILKEKMYLEGQQFCFLFLLKWFKYK